MKKRLRNLLAPVWVLAFMLTVAVVPVHAAGQTVLVLPFQAHAGPEMPNAAQDVPQLICDQLAQNGLQVIPMDRSRALFTRGGTGSIDLAEARRLGRAAGADMVVYGSFNQLGDGFSLDTRLVPVKQGEAVPATFERDSLLALGECAGTLASRAVGVLPGASSLM